MNGKNSTPNESESNYHEIFKIKSSFWNIYQKKSEIINEIYTNIKDFDCNIKNLEIQKSESKNDLESLIEAKNNQSLQGFIDSKLKKLQVEENKIKEAIVTIDFEMNSINEAIKLNEQLLSTLNQKQSKFLETTSFIEETLDRDVNNFNSASNKRELEDFYKAKGDYEKKAYHTLRIEALIKEGEQEAKDLETKKTTINNEKLEADTKLNTEKNGLETQKTKLTKIENEIETLGKTKTDLEEKKKASETSKQNLEVEFNKKKTETDAEVTKLISQRDEQVKFSISGGFKSDFYIKFKDNPVLCEEHILPNCNNYERNWYHLAICDRDTGFIKLSAMEQFLRKNKKIVDPILNAYKKNLGNTDDLLIIHTYGRQGIKEPHYIYVKSNGQQLTETYGDSDRAYNNSIYLKSSAQKISKVNKSIDSKKKELGLYDDKFEKHRKDLIQITTSLNTCNASISKKNVEKEDVQSLIKKHELELIRLTDLIKNKEKLIKTCNQLIDSCYEKIKRLKTEANQGTQYSEKFLEKKDNIEQKIEFTQEDIQKQKSLGHTISKDKGKLLSLSEEKTREQSKLKDLQDNIENFKSGGYNYKEQAMVLETEILIKMDNLEQISKKIEVQSNERNFLINASLVKYEALFTGYTSSYKDELDNLIKCVLQPIFRSFEIYNLGGKLNLSCPEFIEQNISTIRKALNSYILNEINQNTLNKIIDEINKEFRDEYIKLRGILIDPLIQDNANVINIDKEEVDIIIFKDSNNYILVTHEGLVNEDQLSKAYRILSNLLESSTLIKDLCLKSLYKLTDNLKLEACSIEQLQKYFAKSTKLLEKIDNFHEFNDQMINIKEQESNNVSEIAVCQLKRLESLCQIEKKSKNKKSLSTQAYELFQLFKDHYLSQLKKFIHEELDKRLYSGNEGLDLLTASKKNQIKNKIKDLEIDLEQIKKETKKQEEEIEKEKQKLAQRKEQLEEVQKQDEKQITEINTKTETLKAKVKKLDEELQKLETSGEATKALISSKNQEREAMSKEIKTFEETKNQLDSKIRAQSTALQNLEKEKITLEAQKKSLEFKRQSNEGKVKELEDKLKALNMWQNFLKALCERLINNQELFTNRATLLKAIQGAQTNISLKDLKPVMKLYKTLMSQDGLKDLGSNELENSINSSNDPEMHDQLDIILKELLIDPSLVWVSHEDKYIAKGRNVSYKQGYKQITDDIINKLKNYGLDIKDEKLIVINHNLLYSVSTLPPRLKDLFFVKIKTMNKPRVAKNECTWDELTQEFKTEKQAKDVINPLDISFDDILRCFAKTIEIIAGQNLYIDDNIVAHGVNISLYSKQTIWCKSQLKIDTSGKNPNEFKFPRAQNGEFYRFESNNQPKGHDGDDGLNGFTGINAGHITIKSENQIKNIKEIICCHANGGQGMKGQLGGHGDEGREGTGTADAVAKDTIAIGPAQYRLAEAHIPGEDANQQFTKLNEFSGRGGSAGFAGLGGEGGYAGEVQIEDQQNCIKKLKSDQEFQFSGLIGSASLEWKEKFQANSGLRGDDAKRDGKGGSGGKPGPVGADHQIVKVGKWKESIYLKGEFDEKIFSDHKPFMRANNSSWVFGTVMGTAITGAATVSGLAAGVSFLFFGAVLLNPLGWALLAFAPLALIINFGIINNLEKEVNHDGYCNDFRRQIRLYDKFAEVTQLKTESEYRINPRRDERSRGAKGEDNINRIKKENTRHKAVYEENASISISHIANLRQEANVLSQNQKFDEIMQFNEKRIEKEQSNVTRLSNEIIQAQNKEAQNLTRINDLASQVEKMRQDIQKLTDEQNQMEQILSNKEAVLNAHDEAIINTINSYAILKGQISSLRAEVECAKIDITNNQLVSLGMNQIKQNLTNALASSKQLLKSNITSIQQNLNNSNQQRILVEQYLSSALQEYENLERELEEKLNNIDGINELRQGLGQISEKTDSTLMETEEVQISAEYKPPIQKKNSHLANLSPEINENSMTFLPKKASSLRISEINELESLNKSTLILYFKKLIGKKIKVKKASKLSTILRKFNESFMELFEAKKHQEIIDFLEYYNKLLRSQFQTVTEDHDDLNRIYYQLNSLADQIESIFKIDNSEKSNPQYDFGKALITIIGDMSISLDQICEVKIIGIVS